MRGLEVQSQTDFSGGSYQNPARELIPANGFAYAINGLLEEDGTVYCRGGSVYKSNTNFAANLTFLWDGYLTGGSRTVFASTTNFGVLDSDDATPVSIGGSGTDGQRPAVGNGLLFVLNGASGSAGQVTVYGGSRKASAYSTGTVTTTSGSTTVTGSGTLFSANVDPGMLLTSGGAVLGVVLTVDSNTQITLRDPARSVVAGVAFSAAPTFTYTPFGAVPLSAIAYVSGRLVGATGSDVRFLAQFNGISGAGPFTAWANTDYHRISQGAAIPGMEALRNRLFVFTTQGIFTVNNMDFALTDAAGNIQQSVQQINRDVVLLDGRAVSGWNGSLVVCATDDVYLVSESAAPQPLSAPVRKRYRDYINAGYSVSFCAVYRNHLFMPVVNGTTWIDTMVLRLDQGGWTFWDGHGGTSRGFASRAASGAARLPKILSINAARVLDMSQAFTPTGSVKNDADGTTHQFTLVTRDYMTDGQRKALVKKLRLRYELNDAANDDPTLTLDYGTGQVVVGNPLWGTVTWGAFTWGTSSVEQFSSITGTAPEDNGTTPYVWPIVTGGTGIRQRFVRFRIRSVGPRAKLSIRSLEAFVRAGTRQ